MSCEGSLRLLHSCCSDETLYLRTTFLQLGIVIFHIKVHVKVL